MQTGRAPLAAGSARSLLMIFLCQSCPPCERFRRNTETPASMSDRITASDSLAGPSVAIIFERISVASDFF
jgi:hypothetical protein